MGTVEIIKALNSPRITACPAFALNGRAIKNAALATCGSWAEAELRHKIKELGLHYLLHSHVRVGGPMEFVAVAYLVSNRRMLPGEFLIGTDAAEIKASTYQYRNSGSAT